MTRTVIVCTLLGLGAAGFTTSCGEEIAGEPSVTTSAVPPLDGAHDASADAAMGTDSDASPARCCPISEEPACGMHLGGTRGEVSCDKAFSGFALPDDRWFILPDGNGCPLWYEPEWLTPWACCGCPTPPDAEACLDVTKDVLTLPEAERICLEQDSCNICVQARDAESDFDVLSYYITPSSECGCFIRAEIYEDAG